MIVVFASTAFIPTGAEVGVAGGTTLLSQKVLEAVFGDQAVRRLADRARADLLDRVARAAGDRGGAVRRPAARRTPPTPATRPPWSGRRGVDDGPSDGTSGQARAGRLPGRRAAPTADAETVAARLRALDRVVELAADRLARRCSPARATVAQRAGERLRLSGDHTVVALAGATGSGKSSLFNALAGTGLATSGVRRPTTGVAHAVVWGADGAGPLLDWLDVPRRHHLGARSSTPATATCAGWCCSTCRTTTRRSGAPLEVDRLVALVDVLVWVLDPQKYADAAVHDRYLRPLARHGEVMVVVLNQVDRLDPADVPGTVRGRAPAARGRRAGRRPGARHVGDHGRRPRPAARRADRGGGRAPGGVAPDLRRTSTGWGPTSRRPSAARHATTSTTGRSGR